MALEAVLRTSMNIFKKLITYLKDVKVELKKVNWPTRKQATKYTLIVIGVCISTAIFLGGVDYLFSWILRVFI